MLRILSFLLVGVASSVFADSWISLVPRPSSSDLIQKPTLSLNGTWLFGEKAKEIEVPGEWRMQGFQVEKGKPGIYQRKVQIPEEWREMDGLLRFDCVHAECSVFWDGKKIGEHKGGFVPFELTIPRVLPGIHILRVEAISESIADTLSTASQYACHQVGGILRDVTISALPPLHISSARVETTIQKDQKAATLNCHLVLENPGNLDTSLETLLREKDGRIVARNRMPVPAGTGQRMKVQLEVQDPLLWTSETPDLYSVEWNLLSNGKKYCGVSRKIGLREIKREGNRIFVNGNPVKLLAVNRHEVHPLRGRSLTKELCWQDARMYKSANVNCVRTSHYPPSEEFLNACDTLGIFVECEAALCWIQHGANPVWRNGWNWLDRKYLPYMIGANLDQIKAYANHPCIIMWSLGNESRWSPLWEETLKAAKQADPTRPFSFHDQCWGGFNNAGSKADICVYHYPSEANTHMWSEKDRPVWFGEYAHLQCYNRMENQTDPGIREDWGRPLARMVDLMWQQPGCLGGAIWSGIDDLFILPEGKLCGYGHWGVIDGWRREKPETEGVRRAYAPVRLTSKQSGQNLCITLQNRYNFLYLTQISWKTADGKEGKSSLQIAPHQTGSIEIPFSDGFSVCILNSRKNVAFSGCYGTLSVPSQFKLLTGLKGEEIVFNPDASFSVAGAKFPAPRPCVIPLNGSGGASGPAGSVLSQNIPPFTPVETFSWHASDLEKKRFVGENDLLSAELLYTLNKDHSVELSYRYTLKKNVNPRQWGIVFSLPQDTDTLHWARQIEGEQYPEEQIGRSTGIAKVGPMPSQEAQPKSSSLSWSLDPHPLGTPDFRSTRTRLRWIALGKEGKRTLLLTPSEEKGTLPAARAWREGNAIYLLSAGWNTGGFEGFFNMHYSAERRPLKANQTITGKFRFRFLKTDSELGL